MGELAAHLDGNIVISRAMKDSDARLRVRAWQFGQDFPGYRSFRGVIAPTNTMRKNPIGMQNQRAAIRL
jgi:hypothetical protein